MLHDSRPKTADPKPDLPHEPQKNRVLALEIAKFLDFQVEMDLVTPANRRKIRVLTRREASA
jgi:hypothetical protein